MMVDAMLNLPMVMQGQSMQLLRVVMLITCTYMIVAIPACSIDCIKYSLLPILRHGDILGGGGSRRGRPGITYECICIMLMLTEG